MQPNDDLSKQIETLSQNIIELTQTIKQLIQTEEAKKQKKKRKPSPSPLTEPEILALKTRFDELYEGWASGNEYEVKNQLEVMTLDELRRLADANNLTVNKKQSKEKVLRAILTRFREKKMLFTNVVAADKD